MKKLLCLLLSISMVSSTLLLSGRAMPVRAETAAPNVNLDVQDSSIHLQTGGESYQFTKDSSNTWGVDGIYVNGVKTASIDAQSVNLAVGRTCTVSGVDEGLSSSCIAYATDTDPNSFWQSGRFDNTVVPGWLYVDLGGAYPVNKVVIKVPSGWGSRTQTLSIETSTDSAQWTTAVASATYTFDPSASNSVDISFPATVSAQYVRVSFTANSQASGGQISQLEVYQDVSSNGGFFTGSGRATGYTVLFNDGDSRAVQFTGTVNGTNWSVTYTVNAADNLPAFHIAFSGLSSNSVIYRTVNADQNQSGTWITRGVIAADAENKDWTYFDGNGPVVFGHSKSDGVDAAYVIMPKLNTFVPQNNKSEMQTDSFFKSGREDDGLGDGGYYGFYGIKMGADEPQEYAIVFDRDLGGTNNGTYDGRVYQVCEKYYASVVKALGTIGNDLSGIKPALNASASSIRGDTALQNDPIPLINPEEYVPGYGWRSYEANQALGYPYILAQLPDQMGVSLYYEGLATGRDWEKNYGAWVMDTMKFRATDPIQYKNIPNITEDNIGTKYPAPVTSTNVPYTNGEYISKGDNGWARIAQSVRPSLGFLVGGVIGYLNSPTNWTTSVGSHNDIWCSESLLDYGLISGNQDLTDLGLDTIKYDEYVKFDWNQMEFPSGDDNCWNPITDTLISTDWARSDEATAAFAYWLEVRNQQTGDARSLTDADKIIDWISTPMRNETQMDKFTLPGSGRDPYNQANTFWGASSIGRFVCALLNKYDRSQDISYKDAALDLAWDGILLYGMTPDFAGVSLAANRKGVDFDCSPFLMFEQDLAIVPMAGKLLDYVGGDEYANSYGTFFTLFNSAPVNSFKDDNGLLLTNTVYSGGQYDAQARTLSNLMFALDKSSDSNVTVLEKLVSKLDPAVNQKRDMLVVNATSQARNTQIQIRYLKAGTYSLTVNGVSQGAETAQQLSSGITLSMQANSVSSVQVTNLSLDGSTPAQKAYDKSVTYLSDISDDGATSVYYDEKYKKNTSYGGNAINLGGISYSKGIGMRNSTAVLYKLNGSYQTFKATVGVDNEVANATDPAPTLSFRVFVDGVLKFDSGTMDKSSSKQDVSVDVANAQEIMLQMTNNYDGSSQADGNNDHGDWANACLVGFAATSAVIPVSSIAVAAAGGAASISYGHSLQMSAAVSPSDATDRSVTWSVENGTGTASINSTSGLLTATGVGTVAVKATANDNSGVTGVTEITITAADAGGSGNSSPLPRTITGTSTTNSDGTTSTTATIPSGAADSGTVSTVTARLGNVWVQAPSSVLSTALGGDSTASLAMSQSPSSSIVQQAAFQAVTANGGTPIASLNLNLARVAANGAATAVHQLSGDVTVTVTLTPAQIAALNGGTPDIYYFNTNVNPAVLTDMHATYDAAKGTLTFTTAHFSTYVVTTSASTAALYTPGVSYAGHVQNIGWQRTVSNGAEAGTEHKSLRMEGVQIKLTGTLPTGASIVYQAHVQRSGWMAPAADNALVGTVGKSLRMEALRVTLKGLTGYAVKYRAYVQHYGWLGWVTTTNGTDMSKAAIAGTIGERLRMEALEIEIVKVS